MHSGNQLLSIASRPLSSEPQCLSRKGLFNPVSSQIVSCHALGLLEEQHVHSPFEVPLQQLTSAVNQESMYSIVAQMFGKAKQINTTHHRLRENLKELVDRTSNQSPWPRSASMKGTVFQKKSQKAINSSLA